MTSSNSDQLPVTTIVQQPATPVLKPVCPSDAVGISATRSDSELWHEYTAGNQYVNMATFEEQMARVKGEPSLSYVIKYRVFAYDSVTKVEKGFVSFKPGDPYRLKMEEGCDFVLPKDHDTFDWFHHAAFQAIPVKLVLKISADGGFNWKEEDPPYKIYYQAHGIVWEK